MTQVQTSKTAFDRNRLVLSDVINERAIRRSRRANRSARRTRLA